MQTDKKLSEVTALVMDNGLFVEVARTLGKTYKKVYYFCPSISGFPKMNNAMIGYGFDEIEIVTDIFGDHFDSVDIFIALDVYFGPLQEQLVKMGKRVWGSRMGEDLELYRDGTMELMKQFGLPTPEYEVIQGVDNLKLYLKDNPDKFVKINKFRGHMETFYAKDLASVDVRLDELAYQLGAFKTITEFVVTENLKDREEYGIDGYCIDGVFPKLIFNGFEVKDRGDIGKMMPYADIPEPVTRWERVMKPVLKNYGYRGFLSTEVRIGEDKEPYMIDCCARCYSEDTMVLTNDGWKFFSDCGPEEYYATLNTNNLGVEYQQATNHIRKKHNGEMILFKNILDSNTDILVTPDHDMLSFENDSFVKIPAQEITSTKRFPVNEYNQILFQEFKVEKTIQYNGLVHCVTVPNGNVYVKRSGDGVFCGNCGSPPSELYQLLFVNLADIIWQGAAGVCIDPIPKATWGAEILLHSTWADKNWQPISFPEKYRDNVKLRNACKIDGKYYAIPQAVGLPEVGAVVGYGNTMQEAIDMAKEISATVEGYYIENCADSLDEAQEIIDNANKLFPGMM